MLNLKTHNSKEFQCLFSVCFRAFDATLSSKKPMDSINERQQWHILAKRDIFGSGSSIWVKFFNDRQGILAFFFFSLGCLLFVATPVFVRDGINYQKETTLAPHLPLFCALGRGCQHVKIVWVARGSDRMSTLCLSYVALICIANTRIPTYPYGLLHTGLHPPTLHAFTQSTLLGCTALLRFSIHLSLSADERQEKHLLPEEVVTLCGERKRKRVMIKPAWKNKKPVYKYHLCSF